jgi:hypothetical protein
MTAISHSDPLAEFHAHEDAQQAAWERRYNRRLAAHPNCADPDHPGCAGCDDDGDGQEEDE